MERTPLPPLTASRATSRGHCTIPAGATHPDASVDSASRWCTRAALSLPPPWAPGPPHPHPAHQALSYLRTFAHTPFATLLEYSEAALNRQCRCGGNVGTTAVSTVLPPCDPASDTCWSTPSRDTSQDGSVITPFLSVRKLRHRERN